MRRGLAILMVLVSGLVLVAGCTETWTRPGSDQNDFVRVKELCDARGRDRFPPKLEQQFSGGGSSGCNGMQRNCTMTLPSAVTVDGNESAREKESRLCLQQNGWSPR